jgi:hypothetical protein
MRRVLLCAFTAVGAAVLVAGCGDGPLTVLDVPITASAEGGALQLRNGSLVPVNYLAVDRNALALFDWAPCLGPACPAIPPHGSVSVPYDSIAEYSSATTEVVVYWWHSVPDGHGGYRADGMQFVVVPL